MILPMIVALAVQQPVVEPQTIHTRQLLQAVSVVSERVAWVGGHGGTYARTVDGGTTWSAGIVPGADSLQFRDVYAVDANTAYLLSAGTGALSAVYQTTDGGAHWTRQIVNPDSNGFWDCFDFWDPVNGLLYGDAVDGRLTVLRTADGGAHWSAVPAEGLPPALAGEGGFAASGTCLTTAGHGEAWIGTGAGGVARVLHTTDAGDTWTVVEVPIAAGTPASGITTLAWLSEKDGAALGGDIAASTSYSANVAVTHDGGRTWTAVLHPTFPGAVYGAAYARGTSTPALVAVGPRGMDYSPDDGRTWVSLSLDAYWAVGFAPGAPVGWAVGPRGSIVKLGF